MIFMTSYSDTCCILPWCRCFSTGRPCSWTLTLSLVLEVTWCLLFHFLLGPTVLPAPDITVMLCFKYMGGASLLLGACSPCCCGNGNHRDKVGPRQLGQCFPNIFVLWHRKTIFYDTPGKMAFSPSSPCCWEVLYLFTIYISWKLWVRVLLWMMVSARL